MTNSTPSKTAWFIKSIAILSLILSFQFSSVAQCGDLYIAGVIDGPNSNPKALQLCASAAIPDLSVYGLEVAFNGNPSGGNPTVSFPMDALAAGDCIWIANNFAGFNAFFGFDACYDGFPAVNGDDAILLYCGGVVVDAFGMVGTDGTGQCWEYLDGWAVNTTGAQNGGTFNCADYSFSGINALDGETDNGSAMTPYPSPTSNCPSQACSITNVSIMTQGFCSGDDAMYTICADVVGGSGNYSIVDGALNTLASGSGGGAGNICITATIAGPTSVGTIDVDFADASDNSCIGGAPVTVNIPDCPQVNNCPMAFISEFAYDCDMDDANEMVEICVPNSFSGNLSDLEVELYNGNGDVVYLTLVVGVDLIVGNSDATNTYYVYTGTGNSIQNGPDGIALSFQGVTCEFISYEGTITAADGSATGMTSTNIGINQTNSTTCDMTLQLCNGVWESGIGSPGSGNSCSGAMCPDLTAAAPAVVITDSTCPSGNTATGGMIDVPAVACPAGSTLEYSEDGTNWTVTLPTYLQNGPVQTIMTRCVCESDMAIISPASSVMTSPGVCTDCGASISTFPANGN